MVLADVALLDGSQSAAPLGEAAGQSSMTTVQWAQLRRLYSRSRPFMNGYLIPFLRLSWLGRAAQVCRSWRRMCYDPAVVARCVAQGGVDDAERGLFWLCQVGMAPTEALGVLSVLAHSPPAGRDALFQSIHDNTPRSSASSESGRSPGAGGQRRASNPTSPVKAQDEGSPCCSPTTPVMSPPRSASRPASGPNSPTNPREGFVPCYETAAADKLDKHAGKFARQNVERVPGLYEALFASAQATSAADMAGGRGAMSQCVTDIEKDISRTANFENRTALRGVLYGLSAFLPEGIGYVQGQNLVARFLLIIMREDQEDTFWAWVGMMHQFDLLGLYTPGMPRLRLRFFQLNRLVLWHLPRLHAHFASCDVAADLYATPWFITLLADGSMLPEQQTRVIWDRIFMQCGAPAEQWSCIYGVLLELLRRAEPMLLGLARFDDLIQMLTHLPIKDLLFPGEGAVALLERAASAFEASVPLPCQLLMIEDEWHDVERAEQDLAALALRKRARFFSRVASG
eukprot:TRINITY_DN15441_c0_g1_i1.p1 TRINITY_DN15441_c0_g1~~TRINITY_DN15441_c0_g1_i1.p1  ORF type:complete len:514 (+),score=182.77 TRINITY_DN15441_c0_g1_i1:151-1692(+)